MSIRLLGCALALVPVFAQGGDYYYMEPAALSRPPKEINATQASNPAKAFIEQLLGAHEITSGDRLVLLIREYGSGGGVIDANTYTKLTIELGSVRYGERIDLASSDVRLYYSHGGSSWVLKGSGYYATKMAGWIRLLRHDPGSIEVSLDASGFGQWADRRGPEKPFSLKSKYTLTQLSFAELTPWLGSDVSTDTWVAASRPDK
jgi:hypothetical protein